MNFTRALVGTPRCGVWGGMRAARTPERQWSLHVARTAQRAVPTFALLAIASAAAAQPIIIGSKKFTESYVLAELAKRSFAQAGVPAEHRQGMGGTIILWEALRTGQISAYPEYTGTIAE